MSVASDSCSLVELLSITTFQSLINTQSILDLLSPHTPSTSRGKLVISNDGENQLAFIGQVFLLKMIRDLRPHVMPRSDAVARCLDKILENYDSENSMDSEEYTETLFDLIVEKCRKNLVGQLAVYPMNNYLKLDLLIRDSSSAQFVALDSFIEKYFVLNFSSLKAMEQPERIILVNSLLKLVNYLVAEIIELSSNTTMDLSSSVVGCPVIESSIVADIELHDSLPDWLYKKRSYLSLLEDELYNLHTDASQVIHRSNVGCFGAMPTDIHSNILKFVENYSELLNLRTICKYWNSLIVENDEIWKYCYYNTLVQDISFTCFTTRTKIETLQKNEFKTWRAKFFSTIAPLLKCRKSLIVNHLKKKSLELSEEESWKKQVSFSFNFYRALTLFFSPPSLECVTRIGGTPNMTPPVSSKIWKDGYVFIAQMNCNQLFSTIEYELPKSGFLYFFGKISVSMDSATPILDSRDGYVIYQDYEDSTNVPILDGSFAKASVSNFGQPTKYELGMSINTEAFRYEKNDYNDRHSSGHSAIVTHYEAVIIGKYFDNFSSEQISENEIVLLEAMVNFPDTPCQSTVTYLIDKESLTALDWGKVRFTVQLPKYVYM